VSSKNTLAGENVDLAELDRHYHFHPFTALGDHEKKGPPVVMAKGDGVWIEDVDGHRYIDGLAGLWCVNVGYGRRELADAMKNQAETLAYCHAFSSMSSDMPALLSERLIKNAPVPMSKVFFGLSGSDANDTQVKICWYYNNVLGRPEKKKIISSKRGYHGVTIMSGGMTGLPGVHAGFDLPLPFVKHTTAPHRLWEGQGLSDAEFVEKLVADLERLIDEEGADTIAAMIVEPVMGAGGVIVPPKGYFEAIQPVLARHDILLIADEVICGFGRLGDMWGCQAMNIDPDLITIAKGLTSAYFPLSGCIVSDKVWQTLIAGGEKFGVFGHGYTYTAHPIGAAVAMANLDIIDNEELVTNAARRGAYLHERLRAAFSDHPLVGEVRGLGLVGAVEFVARKDPAQAFDPKLTVGIRIAREALSRGLITRALPAADSIAFSPPLTITEAEIDLTVDRAREATDAVLHELRKEGVWKH
jgi:L-2,4-diaminobutyrate transaminase